MSDEYTKGPWYVGSGTHEGRNIYSVASVTDDEGFTYQPIVASAEDDGIKCWDANARLIAAAPDLLKALQRIADGQEMSGVFTSADVVLRYQEIARAAIARATGELE